MVRGVPFIHRIFLCGVYADSPARAKLMYTLANWLAYVVCPFCVLVATAVGSTRRYLGYCEPVRGGLRRGEPGQAWPMERQVLMDGGGPGRQQDQAQLDSITMLHLATRAGQEAAKPSVQREHVGAALRFTGCSPLLRLPYVDAKTLWIIPIAHAFLYGVVKDFVGAILAPGSRGQVSRMCC